MPAYWIVDPDARSIEAYVLSEGVLQITARIAGAGRGSLPPFPDLTIDAASLWRGASQPSDPSRRLRSDDELHVAIEDLQYRHELVNRLPIVGLIQ
jgi:hypothetical protein